MSGLTHIGPKISDRNQSEQRTQPLTNVSHTVYHKYFINFAKPNPTEFKRGVITHPMEMPSAERAVANIGYVIFRQSN